MRVRYKQTECVCVVCGTPFIAFSARAKTCTEVCRKRLSRHRRKALMAQTYETPVPGLPTPVTLRASPGAVMRPPLAGLERRSPPLTPIAQFLRLAAPGAYASRL